MTLPLNIKIKPQYYTSISASVIFKHSKCGMSSLPFKKYLLYINLFHSINLQCINTPKFHPCMSYRRITF